MSSIFSNSGYSNKETDNTEISVIYDNQGEYDYLVQNKLEENENPTSLECVISQDLINLNDRYLNNCLLNLQENFVQKTQNKLLKTKFFPELQLEKLIEIHTKLQEELKVVLYDYKQVFKFFQNHEEEFLTYCDVIPKTRQLMEFIKTKIESNKEIREEVDKLTEESFHSKWNKDAQDLIGELLYRIPEAMMRYPFVLGEIAKEARKEDFITIEKEAQKAHEMMLKIMKHVDKCSKDNTNIETVRKFEISWNCVGKLKNKGLLLREVSDVGIRMKNNSKRKFQCWILVFEEILVVFEVKEKINYQYKKDGKEIELGFFSGEPIIENISMEYHFFQKFKIANFSEINPIENGNNLEMITYEKGILEDPSRSFEILFSSKEGRQEFTVFLEEQKSKLEKFVNVNSGSKHVNHDFEIYQNDYLEAPKMYQKCFECRDFLGGIVITAIYCNTCEQYFHLPCFELNTNDDTDEEEEDASIHESGTNTVCPVSNVKYFMMIL